VLDEEQRARLDATLAELAPLFDLQAAPPAGSDAVADVPALSAGHAMVEELAAAGCERADALAQAAARNAAQLVATADADASRQAGSAASEPGATSAQQEQAGAQPAAAAAQDPTAAPDEAAAAAGAPAALRALSELHAEGVRTLAELCSLCLERLMALGRSLSAYHRYGRKANDGITWPAAPAAAGALLRRQAARMLDELAGLGGAFGAALAAAGERQDTSWVFGAACLCAG
jgi:hypothetical protein